MVCPLELSLATQGAGRHEPSATWRLPKGSRWCVPGVVVGRLRQIDTVGMHDVSCRLGTAITVIRDGSVSVRLRGRGGSAVITQVHGVSPNAGRLSPNGGRQPGALWCVPECCCVT